jgi:predicted phosphate transport protein (TIGR00153 family)
MLFASKQKKIEEQLTDYRHKVALCLDGFYQALRQYSESKDRKQLEENFVKVSRIESEADDIRREIEVMMYSKALFPESRGDIMGLLEAVDKVPNQAEAAVEMLLTHRIEIPEVFGSKILRLAEICHRCVETLLDGMGKLFTDFTNATAAIGQVDELESEADKLEAVLTELIFASQIDGYDKLLLRDLVANIAAVADRAENAGDRIRIIVAKRKI